MGIDVRFWGVRGSLPCSSPEYIIYGGNTSCVELDLDGKIIILDAGSGIRPLGDSLISRGETNFILLLSHCHWDHICGFPFFFPIFKDDVSMDIYASCFPEQMCAKEVFETQMSAPFFPLPLHMVASKIKFHDFQCGDEFELYNNSVKVMTRPLLHPNGATGYRIEYKGKSIAYITDTEHTPGEEDSNVLTLIHNCDLMIYDAMFSENEFEEHIGWGHSTWEEALRLATLGNVKKTALFHHSPSHNDEKMAHIEAAIKKQNPSVFAAKDGLKLSI